MEKPKWFGSYERLIVREVQSKERMDRTRD